MGALAGPGEVEAFTLAGDGEALKDIEVLEGANRGAVGSGKSLDCVLNGHFTGRFEDPADLDGSVIVAHEGDG